MAPPQTPFYFYTAALPKGIYSNFFHAPFVAASPPACLLPHLAPSSPTQLVQRLLRFDTTEQYLMHAKALLFHDAHMAESILQAKQPKDCKALGRKVEAFSEGTWKVFREKIMVEGLVFKFRGCFVKRRVSCKGTAGIGLDGVIVPAGTKLVGHEAHEFEVVPLAAVLLETGERMMVEASPTDRIWGIGFAMNDAEGNESRWGLNLLGKAFVRAREILRKESGGGL